MPYLSIRRVNKMPELERDPLFELNDEAKKHLEAIKGEIDRSEARLKDFEDLGFDTSRAKEILAWVKKARETVLKTTK
jgi:hypothetical protein